MEYEPNRWTPIDETNLADLSYNLARDANNTNVTWVPGDSSSGSYSSLPFSSSISSGWGSSAWTTQTTEDNWYPTTAAPGAPKDPSIFSSFATQATSNAGTVGAIVGIVIAIVAVIVIFILLCCFREKIMSKVCPEKSLVSDESGDEEEFEVEYSDVRSIGTDSRTGVTRRTTYSGFGSGPRSLVSSTGTPTIETVSVDRVRNEYSNSAMSPASYAEF